MSRNAGVRECLWDGGPAHSIGFGKLHAGGAGLVVSNKLRDCSAQGAKGPRSAQSIGPYASAVVSLHSRNGEAGSLRADL